jgi:hypothetical protein
MRLSLVATDTQSAVLVPGQAVTSEGGQYELQMCHDGNLALIEIPANSRVVWETGTRFRPTGRYYLTLQPDGNLVVYHGEFNGGPAIPLWQSGTYSSDRSGYNLTVSDRASVELRKSLSSTGPLIWTSKPPGS